MKRLAALAIILAALAVTAAPAAAHWQVRRAYCSAGWAHCHVLHR